MFNLKKLISGIAVTAMLIAGLVACNGGDGGGETPGGNNNQGGTGGDAKTKYTLTVWGAEEDQAMLKEMCAAYAAANPQNEYKFLYGVQSESDAADKVLNDVTSGPDVFSFASDQINKLYAGGALARIGGEIEKNVKEINSAGSIDAATLTIGGQDQLFAYPSTGDNCYFVYYDKSVYGDVADLATLDSMLDKADAAGKKVHFKLNDDGWYLSSFFFANPDLKYNVTYDDKMVETGVEINYNNANGLKVMQALKNYVNHNALVIQTDDSKIIAGFTENEGKREIAAAISGTWNAKKIEECLGENMGVIKLPTANIGGEQVQLSGYMGYKLIGVNGYSQNKGEAHKLAQWLTNEQNQLKRFETRGFGPTNKVVADSEAVKNDPVISVVMQQAEFNRAQKGVPGNYWTPMGALITPFIEMKEAGTLLDYPDAELQKLLDALVNQIAGVKVEE